MLAQFDYAQQLLEQYAKLRAENAASVGTNDIDLDPMWGQPCLAYNVQILLPLTMQQMLVNLQEDIHHQEAESLQRCPAHALHVSVASLVPVRAEGSRQDKEAQWQSIQHDSQAALHKIAKTTRAFQVRFCGVIATRGAIIAVATDDGHMQAIREKLCKYVPLRSTPINIIHSTLFRYRARLVDPQRLLASLQTMTLNQPFIVDELQIRRENVYPSLDSDLVLVAKLSRPRDRV